MLEDMGAAMAAGEVLAKELVSIATSSDLGDIREDATASAMARAIIEGQHDMLGVMFAQTVKVLAVGLSVYADRAAGRDPLNPNG